MSGFFSTYLKNALCGEAFGGAAYTSATNLYVALSTTTPTAGNTGVTEPSGNGYARVAVANTSANWTAASNGMVENSTTISFPQATGSWGTVTYAVIYDAATAGNMLAAAQLNTAQTLASGDTLSFNANQLQFTIN